MRDCKWKFRSPRSLSRPFILTFTFHLFMLISNNWIFFFFLLSFLNLICSLMSRGLKSGRTFWNALGFFFFFLRWDEYLSSVKMNSRCLHLSSHALWIFICLQGFSKWHDHLCLRTEWAIFIEYYNLQTFCLFKPQQRELRPYETTVDEQCPSSSCCLTVLFMRHSRYEPC